MLNKYVSTIWRKILNKNSCKLSAVILSFMMTLSYITVSPSCTVPVSARPMESGAVSVRFTDVQPEGTDATDETGSSSDPSEDPASTEAPADISDLNAPAIVSGSAIVMDAKTGTILYEKNARTRCYPASITKVMTCLVALEHVNMTDTITFSNDAIWGIERDSNHIALDVGEQITAEQCFYAILLQSANEASWGMAEHVGGSLEGFSDMMNAKAVELGCQDTHFVNPHGLHDDDHYTTAYDMALIMQAAMNNPLFRTIDETIYYQIPPTNICEEPRDLWHQLKPIFPTSPYYYEPIEGGKTGFTDQARNTAVTYAKKNDMELICVVMNCEGAANSYQDMTALYNYYFDNYTYVYPLQTFNPNNINHSDLILNNFYHGLDHDTLNLSVNNDLTVLLPRNMDPAALTTQTAYYPTLENNIVGKVTVSYNGSVIGDSDIVYHDMTVNGEVLRWGISPEEHQKRLNNTLIIAVSAIILVSLSLFIIFRIRNRRYRYLKRRSKTSALHF